MANIQGRILGQVYGGPDNPALNMVRCQVSGPLASGDVVYFGDNLALFGGNFQQYIPQGADPSDAILRVVDAGSSVHFSAGYAAADGAAGTTDSVADVNATYFLSNQSITGTSVTRATGPTTIVKLQRPTNPTLTVVSGGLGQEAAIELDVYYTYRGNQGANTVSDS